MSSVPESGDSARKRDRFEQLLLDDLDHLDDPAPESWRQALRRLESEPVDHEGARQRRIEREREQRRQKAIEDGARRARLDALIVRQQHVPAPKQPPAQPQSMWCERGEDCLLSIYGKHTHHVWTAEEEAEAERDSDELMAEILSPDWPWGSSPIRPHLPAQHEPVAPVVTLDDSWGAPSGSTTSPVVSTTSDIGTGLTTRLSVSTVASTTTVLSTKSGTRVGALTSGVRSSAHERDQVLMNSSVAVQQQGASAHEPVRVPPACSADQEQHQDQQQHEHEHEGSDGLQGPISRQRIQSEHEPEEHREHEHRDHRARLHKVTIGWPRYPTMPSEEVTWYDTSKERTTGFLTAKGHQWLDAETARTGQIDFSDDADVDRLVEHLVAEASRGDRAKLWCECDQEDHDHYAEHKFMKRPLSWLEGRARWIAVNLCVGAVKPNLLVTHAEKAATAKYKRLSALHSAHEARVQENNPEFELKPSRALLASVKALPRRRRTAAPELPDPETHRYRPLHDPDHFKNRQAALGTRSGESRRARAEKQRAVLLDLPPVRLSALDAAAWLSEHRGVTIPVGTMRRWWSDMEKAGLVEAGDPRRPHHGGARKQVRS